MDAADDGATDEASRKDELAEKVASLPKDKQALYEQQVQRVSTEDREASLEYRLALANTLLKNFPAPHEAGEINDLKDLEEKRARLESQRTDGHSTVQSKQSAPQMENSPLVADKAAAQMETKQKQDLGKGAEKAELPPKPQEFGTPIWSQQAATTERQRMQVGRYDALRDASSSSPPPRRGGRPEGDGSPSPQRDGEARHNAGRGAAGESSTAALSKEQLQGMVERYAEVRKAGKLEPTPSDRRERSDLAALHSASGEKLDRDHGSAPNEQQKQERVLLDHQQLAERVGLEARLLGQHFRRQGSPGAESFEREARSAHHTARSVHEQRQNLGMGTDRTRDAARTVQQQEQQKQSAAQEAARGGTTLTSEQRANASPDVKQTLDRNERAEASRGTGLAGKDHSAQAGSARSGNTRTGGRSR